MEENTCGQSSLDKLLNLIEYLVVVKKEIYTLAQRRGFYDQMSDNNSRVLHSSDIKKKFRIDSKTKLASVNQVISTHLTTEYVFSANESILLNAISAILTGEGISNCLQLKNIACSISNDIQFNPKKSWPPTPQDITLQDACQRILYNFIAWISSPNSCMKGDGVVRSSKSKFTKVHKICQNIRPNGQTIIVYSV